MPLIADFTTYDLAYWILVGITTGLFGSAMGLTIIVFTAWFSWRWLVAAVAAWIGTAGMVALMDVLLGPVL